MNVSNLKTAVEIKIEIELAAWANGEKKVNVFNQFDESVLESAKEAISVEAVATIVAKYPVGELCRKAAAIPAGRSGECDFCGEHFARVVEVTHPHTGEVVESCGRCRDRRGIA